MATRIENDVTTGEVTEVPLTQAELDAAAARTAEEQAALDPNVVAPKRIDSIDRLQFEVMWEQENNVRELRALVNILRPGSFTAAQAAQITRAQYRDALIARWKVLNA
jgi:hypothetical protein